MLTDPAGQVLEVSRRRYASPALVDHIRIRDRTCRVPGCTVLAENTEIDHTIRHADQGETSPQNAGAYCKFHNLWKLRTHPLDRRATRSRHTFTFTSPEGRTYTALPDPYDQPPY